MRALFLYVAAINIIALLAMGADKYRARRNKWRISEASLFFLGIAGGGIGMLAGMSLFHHKTRHLKFTLGVPVIITLNLITLGYLFHRLGLL